MKHFCTLLTALMLASSAFATPATDNLSFRKGGKLAPIAHNNGKVKKSRAVSKISPEDLTGDIITEAPEGKTTEYSGASHSWYHVFALTEEDVKGYVTEITVTEDGKAYWKDPLSQAPFGSYIVGDVVGDKITFNFPQHISSDYTYIDWGLVYEFYVALFEATETVDEEGEASVSYSATDNQTVTFTINEDGTITQDGDAIIGMGDYDEWDEYFYFDGYADQNITLAPFADTTVEVPESVNFEDWVFTDDYNDLKKWLVKVGFDGNDVYVKNIAADAPEMTVKGTLDGDKITIANGQYLGKLYSRYNYTQAGTLEYVTDEETGRKVGYVVNIDSDFVFNYDAEAKKMTSPDIDSSLLFACGNGGETYNFVAVNPTIYNQGEITSYVPEAALITRVEDDWAYYEQIGLRFQNNLVNEDGQLLPEENFGYEIYIDGELFTFTAGDPYDHMTEDMTEVPYSYTDGYDIQYTPGTDYHYVYFYFNTMNSVGVRMVYNAPDGQKYYSGFSTMEVDFSGVENVNADKNVKSSEYFDIAGRRVDASAKGLVIKRSTMEDGSVVTSKVIR